MRILVLGADGLIGSNVAAGIAARGDEVVAVTRHQPGAGLIQTHTIIKFDISKARDAADWMPYLIGIDAVVNCAGVLQDSPYDSVTGVHSTGVATLWKACERSGIRRVVHLSAVGVDRATPSAFSKTKLAGDQALMATGLDWVILRPSVVIGEAAYGASALMRGLASLPLRPAFPDTGPLQLVHLDDVVATILFFLDSKAPARQVFEVVGPRSWTFDETISLLRRWLRYRPARVLRTPAIFAKSIYAIGDLVSLLGWRPAVRSTAAREIVRGAAGDPQPLAQFGLLPRDVEAALRATPASVQERWFGKLYFLKPVLFGILPLFWISTGIISLSFGWNHGMGLMREGGVGETMAAYTVIAGASADITIGAAIAWRPAAHVGAKVRRE